MFFFSSVSDVNKTEVVAQLLVIRHTWSMSRFQKKKNKKLKNGYNKNVSFPIFQEM